MDRVLAWYIFRYFGHLMSEAERQASMHLVSTIKTTGRSDRAAQQEASATANKFHQGRLSADPEVLLLASHGYQEFIAKTAQRILDEHGRSDFSEFMFSVWCSGQNTIGQAVLVLRTRLAR